MRRVFYFLGGCFGYDWDDIGELCHLEVSGIAAKTLVAKFNDTRSGGKEGVVRTLHNVVTGADSGTALTYDNIARFHVFTGVFFYTEALTLGIAAVTG